MATDEIDTEIKEYLKEYNQIISILNKCSLIKNLNVIHNIQKEIATYTAGAGEMFKCYNKNCGVMEILKFWGDDNNNNDDLYGSLYGKPLECWGCKKTIYCHVCTVENFKYWAYSEYEQCICGLCDTYFCPDCEITQLRCVKCEYDVCWPKCVAIIVDEENNCLCTDCYT